MDDISEKLKGILNDPESLDRIRKMASSVLGENKAEAQNEQVNNPFGDIDITQIMGVLSKINLNRSEPRAELLKALKPHLSSKRQEKVDTAVKVLKIMEILPVLKESGILKL